LGIDFCISGCRNASGGVERNASEIGGTGMIGWVFKRQRADFAERDAVRLALIAQLHDPTAHAGIQESTTEAADLRTPFEGLTGLW